MLKWALEIAGNEEALAKALHADRESVHSWLQGNVLVPEREFLAAADIVANRSLSTPAHA